MPRLHAKFHQNWCCSFRENWLQTENGSTKVLQLYFRERNYLYKLGTIYKIPNEIDHSRKHLGQFYYLRLNWHEIRELQLRRYPILKMDLSNRSLKLDTLNVIICATFFDHTSIYVLTKEGNSFITCRL